MRRRAVANGHAGRCLPIQIADDVKRVTAVKKTRGNIVNVAVKQRGHAMNNKSSVATIAGLVAFLWGSMTVLSADNRSRTPSPSPSPTAREAASPSPSPRSVPSTFSFHGMVAEIDQKTKTFTLAGKESSRIFKITSRTMITKSGAIATVADISENEEVRGSYVKKPDGTLEARTVMLVAQEKKTRTSHKAEKPKKELSPAESAGTPGAKESLALPP